MDIIFKGRRTEVQDRFRSYAAAKLSKLERLDRKAIRVDVEVTTERNPRQSDRRERVELTIASRGPVIRAEAAADDRYAALDRAFAKLLERLRRSCDRRKDRHGPPADRVPGLRLVPGPAPERDGSGVPGGERGAPDLQSLAGPEPGMAGSAARLATEGLVTIPMEGDGPLVVREKFHAAAPMSIEQALLQMELVGHDFYLFRDSDRDQPSVVYRRHGYQYGVLRLVEEHAAAHAGSPLR
ncbi:MAG: ribosome-associated translation inhibitor RaiA [Nocardiopsaceae bacterium]|jgi:ribosomal subunit interface protein|nr:ribosome-associated translation inhibitor RaiA [Nocardiopsaceae bacterium]